MSTASQFANRSIRYSAMFFAVSGTFTVPVTGIYRIQAIGAGGSGGAFSGVGATGGAATGGGGGAFCETEALLTQGTVLTITVGAGGASVSSASGAVNGNAGGATSVSGTGITTITAGGGLGGNASSSVSVSSPAAATASGGNVLNFSGGRAGAATFSAGAGNVTGGGSAASPYGNGFDSGTCAVTGAANVGASGGGGIGGKSGDVSGSAATAASSGGGTGAASANAVGTTSNAGAVNRFGSNAHIFTSQNNLSLPLSPNDPLRALNGSSTGANVLGNDSPGYGAGGAGYATNTAGSPTGSRCFLLGGSGGIAANNPTSGSVVVGGGSGAASATGTATATSGKGGDGLVIIERLT